MASMASMASIIRPIQPAVLRLSKRQFRRFPIPKVITAARSFSIARVLKAKYYTQDHEWVELSSDKKSGTIGISEYAAHALGDVVFVELPTVSAAVAAGDAIGAVESVKSASDINAPVSGIILEVNKFLEERPTTINSSPEADGEHDGWIARVEIGDEGLKEIEKLMDESAYKAFVSENEGE